LIVLLDIMQVLKLGGEGVFVVKFKR